MAIFNKDMFQAATPGGKYHPDKFYTKSTDGNGHYERIPQTKISPAIEALMGDLIGEYPEEYKGPGDVVRDALMHLVAYRRYNSEGSQEQARARVEREALVNDSERKVAEVRAWGEAIDKLADDVSELVELRQWAYAIDTIQGMEDLVEQGLVPEVYVEKARRTVGSGWEQVRTEMRKKKKRRYSEDD